MKYLEANPELCIGCNTCVDVCSAMFFKEKSKEKSAIKIKEKEDKFDIAVCNQCGKCMALCPAQALKKNSQGVVMLSKTDCIGCLICVAECPIDSMNYLVNENEPFKCIACGACATKCPAGALKIVKE